MTTFTLMKSDFTCQRQHKSIIFHRDESDPYRACKCKRFILKVMFIAVVAWPRFDDASGQYIDGKIGIWPLVYTKLAKWNSNNRTTGTLEMKPVFSVNKVQVIRACFLEKLLPAIREKWPSSYGNLSTFNKISKTSFTC